MRGWDPKTKREITARAGAGDDTSTMGGRDSGPALAQRVVGTSTLVVVDQPPLTPEDAESIAKGRLDDMALDFVTRRGQLHRRATDPARGGSSSAASAGGSPASITSSASRTRSPRARATSPRSPSGGAPHEPLPDARRPPGRARRPPVGPRGGHRDRDQQQRPRHARPGQGEVPGGPRATTTKGRARGRGWRQTVRRQCARVVFLPQVGDEVLVAFDSATSIGPTCSERCGTGRTPRRRATAMGATATSSTRGAAT